MTETTATTLTCPACGARRVTGSTVCDQCGTDLTLVAAWPALANGCYNGALELANQPAKTTQAIASLCAALEFDPDHLDALFVLGKLHAQEGRFAEASEIWKRVLESSSAASADREKAERLIARAGELVRERSTATITTQHRSRVTAWLVPAAVAIVGVGVGMSVSAYKPAPRPGDPVAAVRAALAQNPSLRSTHIEVSQQGNSILLRGEVEAPLLKELAAALALGAADHKPIDANGIEVRPEAASTRIAASLSKFASQIKEARSGKLIDALSTARVSAAPNHDGSVELTGTVPNATIRDLILSVAAAVQVPVVDHIRIVPLPFMTYRIAEGDTPMSIALRLCGNADLWSQIAEAYPENRTAFADTRKLQVGGDIKIPASLITKRPEKETRK